MSKIKIKNFGPIKNGYLENNGWIEIKKVTVFIGNQGSGKSTVAKIISTFTWLEKALIRGDIQSPIDNSDVIDLFAFHRLEDYLEPNSEIGYKGEAYNIELSRNLNDGDFTIVAQRANNKSVSIPKIMYVPAERNFLSSIDNINKVSNLVIGSLQNYSIEFRNAQISDKGKILDLPINNTRIIYNSQEDENYLIFEDNRQLKLSHASSGFHSVVPLHWISKYLIDFIKQDEKKLLQLLSTDQAVRRKNDLKGIDVSNLDERQMKSAERKINSKYICRYFVNIVEEPEQNLFPTSQRRILYSLLKFNNVFKANKLIVTTHSPYLINFLSLSIKAEQLKDLKLDREQEERVNVIVPSKAEIDSDDLAIYQLFENEGIIQRLSDYNGIPSDHNFLNDELGDINEQFDNLLEIQEEI